HGTGDWGHGDSGLGTGGWGLGIRDWEPPPTLSSRASLPCHPARSVGVCSPCTEAGHYALTAITSSLTRRARRDAENSPARETPIAVQFSAALRGSGASG